MNIADCQVQQDYIRMTDNKLFHKENEFIRASYSGCLVYEPCSEDRQS